MAWDPIRGGPASVTNVGIGNPPDSVQETIACSKQTCCAR